MLCNPKITLVHYSNLHSREIEIIRAYSPGYLDFLWGMQLYSINLLKNGEIKGIRTWKIQDLKLAVEIYLDERRREHQMKNLAKGQIRKNDERALAHWKRLGLVDKTASIK